MQPHPCLVTTQLMRLAVGQITNPVVGQRGDDGVFERRTLFDVDTEAGEVFRRHADQGDFVAQLNGGGNTGTGWQTFSFSVPLAAGDHTIVLGGYNSKKTTADEITTVVIDDVLVAVENRPQLPTG